MSVNRLKLQALLIPSLVTATAIASYAGSITGPGADSNGGSHAFRLPGSHGRNEGSRSNHLSVSDGSGASTDDAPASNDRLADSYLEDSIKYFSPSDRAFVHQYLRSGEYMPLSEIKPGMEGYGLTVFHGTKVERFSVKVIGTVKKVLNNRDAILVRLSGAALAQNKVIKGMSGSPVYVGGRLIGAISYGFDFSMEPIAGVTPIVDMLDALAQDTKGISAPQRISKADLPAVTPALIQTGSGSGTSPVNASTAAPHMVPLMAPVSLAGFSPRAERFLADKFQDFGLYCSTGAAGALDESLLKLSRDRGSAAVKKGERPGIADRIHHPLNSSESFEPGSPVAVMLTTGDFNSSACGTATGTFNGKVLAFGHPFLQAGFVDFPMASAYIHQVMPSLFASFKVSSPTKVLGSIVSDRPWAVGGLIGRQAKLIPSTFTVADETRKVAHTYHCSVVDHPDLTPSLLAAAAMSAIDSTHQSSAPYILKVESTIETTNAGKVERVDRFPSNFSAHEGHDGMGHLKLGGNPVAAYLQGAISKIVDNDFQKTGIKSVNLRISLEDGHRAANIERIYLDKPDVAPGDTVQVHCLVRPYNQEPIVRTLSLTLPRDLPDGNLVLAVSSGDEIDGLKKRLGLVDPQPETLKQIVEKIQDAGRADAITAVLALPEQSVSVNGTTLVNPPAHWLKLFFSDKYTHGPALIKGEIKASEVESYLVNGSHIMTVTVKNKDKAQARLQPYLIPSRSASSTAEGVFVTDQAKRAMESVHTDLANTSDSNNKQASSPAAASADRTAPSQSTAIVWAAPKDYPHMRSILMWKQESEKDFKDGKTQESTIDSWGRIAPAFQNVAEKEMGSDMRIWSSVFANGNFYFSTSNKVFSWRGDQSQPDVVASFDSVAIPSIAADAKGILYAALVPGGRVVAIDPQKPRGTNATTILKTVEPIVSCLALDGGDHLFVGVAGSGKVYRLDLHGSAPAQAKLIFDSGQAHIVSMFYCRKESRLYVGTAERGAVYSLDAQGAVKAEYQSPDHIITGIVKDSKGDLYVASAGQGHLVRISKNNEIKTVADSEAFYTLYYDQASDAVFSGDGEGDITEAKLDPLSNQPFFVPVWHTDEEAVLALASDGSGRLFAGTSNLAVVRVMLMKPSSQAAYISQVHDGLRTSKWSRLRVYGAHDEVASQIDSALKVETRTGDTAQPDATWAGWQTAAFAENAFAITSQAGRFLQYRINWKQQALLENAQHPVTPGKIEVTYMPLDLPPSFTSVSLKSGAALAGKQDINITGLDGDGDNMLLTLEVSYDDGKTWKQLATRLRSHSQDNEAANSSPDTKSGSSKSSEDKTDTSQKPVDKPADSGSSDKGKDASKNSGKDASKDASKDSSRDSSKGSSQAYSKDSGRVFLDDSEKESKDPATKKEGQSQESSTADPKDSGKIGTHNKDKKAHGKGKEKAHSNAVTKAKQTDSSQAEKFTYSWDTSKLKDGNYIVRMILDDRISNPENSSQSVLFRAVEVDNSPPEITAVTFKNLPGGKAEIRAQAHDKETAIANATYRFDGGERMALGGIGELSDGLSAIVGADDVSLDKGSRKLEIQVTDRAGNKATKTISVN